MPHMSIEREKSHNNMIYQMGQLPDCRTIWRGFKSCQHEVVFGVVLVPQNNILCENIILSKPVESINSMYTTP